MTTTMTGWEIAVLLEAVIGITAIHFWLLIRK